tara:strand:- start:1223 stop:2083 length:861 start_codon:yes stop_codon:yes gene_type:complete
MIAKSSRIVAAKKNMYALPQSDTCQYIVQGIDMVDSSELSSAEKETIAYEVRMQMFKENGVSMSWKGWVYVILPLTLVLLYVLLYGIQSATGIEVYTLVSGDVRDVNGQSVSHTSSTVNKGGNPVVGGFKLIMARMILAVIVVTICLFVWDAYKKGGATGVLMGGRMAQSGIYDVGRQAKMQEQEEVAHLRALDIQHANAAKKAVGEIQKRLVSQQTDVGRDNGSSLQESADSSMNSMLARPVMTQPTSSTTARPQGSNQSQGGTGGVQRAMDNALDMGQSIDMTS